MRVVVASNNAHKIAEIRAALDIPGWEFVPWGELGDFPEPEENAPDFVGNARIKAYAAYKACGLAALADDSGLEVDALHGAPGVYSARFAGEPCDDAANNAKLLNELQAIPLEERTARFVSTLVLVRPRASMGGQAAQIGALDAPAHAHETSNEGACGRKTSDESASNSEPRDESACLNEACDLVETIARGTVEGHIGFEPIGDQGFGYDPLFMLDDYDGKISMAQLSMDQKNALSHRGNALRVLREMIMEEE